MLIVLLSSACNTTVYYPADVPPAEGWVSACGAAVTATVVVQNDSDEAVDVQELLPEDRCSPSYRGTVQPGQTQDMGAASGSMWRLSSADTGEWLGTFPLTDGENLLQVP